MRKIAVVNFKGGTGKTTSVVNIGAGLALRGKRVLLLDVDPQGSLAISLGLAHTRSLADVLTMQATAQESTVQARSNLFVIPSDNSLLLAQRAVSRYVNWQEALAAALKDVVADYDFLLIDCAASLSPLNINALTYASEIFITTQVEYLSLVGLNQVLENLARVRFPNQPRRSVTDLGISLIIPTMYDVRKRQSRRLLAELRQVYGQHVSTPIRTNVRLSEAPSYQKTIYEFAPASAGAFDYNRLVDLILQETLLVGEEPIGLQRPFQPSREDAPLTAPEEEIPMAAENEETSPADPTPAAPAQPVPAAPEEEEVVAAPPAGPTPAVPAAPEDEEEEEEVAALLAGLTPTVPAPPVPAALEDDEEEEASPAGSTAWAQPAPMSPAVGGPDALPLSLSSCPYCGAPLVTLMVAGYRVYQCDRCGFQKQVLMRDLHAR